MLVYATTETLATYLGDAPPAGSGPLLARASEMVDRMLLGAVYDTDTAGRPTDPQHAGALALATCVLAADALDSLADPAQSVLQGLGSVSFGSVSMTAEKATEATAESVLDDDPRERAYAALRTVGLVPVRVSMW